MEIVTILQGGEVRESREEVEETETHRGTRQKICLVFVKY